MKIFIMRISIRSRTRARVTMIRELTKVKVPLDCIQQNGGGRFERFPLHNLILIRTEAANENQAWENCKDIVQAHMLGMEGGL